MTWRQHLKCLVMAISPTAFMFGMMEMEIERYNARVELMSKLLTKRDWTGA